MDCRDDRRCSVALWTRHSAAVIDFHTWHTPRYPLSVPNTKIFAVRAMLGPHCSNGAGAEKRSDTAVMVLGWKLCLSRAQPMIRRCRTGQHHCCHASWRLSNPRAAQLSTMLCHLHAMTSWSQDARRLDLVCHWSSTSKLTLLYNAYGSWSTAKSSGIIIPCPFSSRGLLARCSPRW